MGPVGYKAAAQVPGHAGPLRAAAEHAGVSGPYAGRGQGGAGGVASGG